MLYSTYFGGSGIDQGLAIAVDPSGAAYLTGTTTSTDFPVKNAFQATAASPGNQHAFVAKLGATGALVYSTYLGGSGNEDFDNGFDGAIAVDASGAAYVVGSTTSADFPVLNAFQGTRPGTTSAYVTKLAPSGSTLAYSTFLGGASTAGASHIAVDASGAAYVVGVTASANFPTTPGALSTTCPACSNFSSEAFVTKLTPAGSALAYSTFLGDIGGSSASGIAIDGAGAAYISGNTSSKNFPTVGTFAPTCIPCAHGLTSGFVSKLNPAGSALVYSNYIGAHGQTGVSSIAVDASGQAVVGGATDAPDFPSIQPVQALGGLGIGASTDVATSYVTSNQGFASSQTHALALDPSNPGVVYAATADGIFKSSNKGTSWATASAGLPVGANVQALAVQPGTGVVLAGVATKGVFKRDRKSTRLNSSHSS